MNIYQKLIEVRKSVPYLQKSEKGFQFNYVSSSQVLGNLKAKMDELGLLLIPSVISKEISEHLTAKGAKEYFTELVMEFIWINADEPSEQIKCPWYGQGLDNGEKGVGKALTYSEKYFMLKFFNIPTDKDDPDSFQKKHDDEPVTKLKPVRQLDPKPKEEKVNWVAFWDSTKKLGYQMEEVQKIANCTDFSKWSKDKAMGLYNDLKVLKMKPAVVGGEQ